MQFSLDERQVSYYNINAIHVKCCNVRFCTKRTESEVLVYEDDVSAKEEAEGKGARFPFKNEYRKWKKSVSQKKSKR